MRAQRSTLIQALRDAAEQYEDLAKDDARELDGLGDQFARQAADCRRLMDEIEQADTISLHD